MSLLNTLSVDLQANRTVDGKAAGMLRTAMTVRFLAVLLFRLSAHSRRYNPILSSMTKAVNHLLTGADISPKADVEPGLVLQHPTGVVIGDNVRLGRFSIVQSGVTMGAAALPASLTGELSTNQFPQAGARCFFGTGSKILGPIVLGDGCVVGANSVVLSDAAARSILVGVPARVIGVRNP